MKILNEKTITLLEKTYIKTKTNIILTNDKEVIYITSNSEIELLHEPISEELKNLNENQNKILPITINDKTKYKDQLIYEIKNENKTKYIVIFYKTDKEIDEKNKWIFESTKRIISKNII